MSIPLIDRVPGTITDQNGVVHNRPATIIWADAAAIMRNYFYWVLRQKLEPELYCTTCYEGRHSKAHYQISEQEIIIVCQCQQRYFRGTWLKPLQAVMPNTSVKDDTVGVAQITLSEDAARLLRLYDRVLIGLGLKEALHCNICYEINPAESGCDAMISVMAIRIRCRCSDRTYHGITI